MNDTHFQIDEDTAYYFLCPVDDRYYTLWIGWIHEDLVKSFQEVDYKKGQAVIQIRLGSNQFNSIVDRPLVLVAYGKAAILQFAVDMAKVDLFPGVVNPPEIGLPSVIDLPAYFTNGIEPYLEFKMGSEFCGNRNGIWVPLAFAD